jgi:hypothetical protein
MKHLYFLVIFIGISLGMIAQTGSDTCTSAESITVTTSQQTISFDTSTAQVNLEEGCAGSAQASYVDVWYSFEMPAAGNIQITSSFFANNFAIYDSCGGTEISCFPQQNLIEDLTPGSTYWIRVFRPSNQAASSGQTFNIRLYESETNDTCATAEDITLNVGNATSTNFSIGGADIINEADCSGDTQELLDVWYKFTMPVTGNVFIDAVSIVNDFAVYDACGGTEISCFTKTNLVEGLTANTEYYVRVFRQKSEASIGPFNFTIEPFAATTNDTCGTADVITLIEGATVNQNFTMGGSDIILEEGCEGTTPAEYIDIWYEFAMPADGTLTISSVLNVNQYAIYDSCGVNKTQLSCSQQFNATGLSQGQTYYLRVFKNKLQAGIKTTEMSLSVTGCNSPENLTASNITQTSAVLTWDGSTSTNQGYDYVLITDGSTPDFSTVPTANVNAGITTVNLQSLSIGTTYDAYVRTNCGNGDFSDWSPVESFTTLSPCLAPTNLSVSNITQNSADLSWDAATSESGGYDYVLFTDGTLPNAATTPTGSVASGITSLGLTNLFTDTAYTVYVRTNCGGVNLSDWSAVLNFDTLAMDEGTALNFDGNNDYVDATASVATLLPQGNSARSVEFSIKTTQTSIGNVVSWGSRTITQRSSFAVREGKAAFIGESRDVTGSITINDGLWHDIAITYDGTDRDGFKIYVDGVLDPGPYDYGWNPSETLNTTDQDLTLGRTPPPSTIEYFNGTVDNIRIWDKELSASEVSTYAGQDIASSTPNLVAYFNFEDAPGNEDNSATGNDITVVNDLTSNYNGNVTNFTRTGNTSNWVNASMLWTGDQDTNWSNANNWSSDIVPLTTESVVIQNVPNQPVISNSTTAEINDLSLSTGSTLSVEGVLKVNNRLINDGSILFRSNATHTGQFDAFTGSITGSGTVTVERYFSENRAFRLVSSPVTTTNFISNNWQQNTHITGAQGTVGNTSDEGFDETATGNPSMFTFDNTNSNGGGQNDDYSAISNTNATNLVVGTPYVILVRGDRNVDLTTNDDFSETTVSANGSLHVGRYPSAANSSVPLNPTSNNWSLVANPYQSKVDFDNVSTQGLNADVTVYSPTVPGYVSLAENRIIEPGKSFWVQNTSNSETRDLFFVETNKTPGIASNGTTVFSDDQIAKVDLELYNQNGKRKDVLKFRFNSNFGSNLDNNDFGKLLNEGENLATNFNMLLSIDRRNIPQDSDVVPLFTSQYLDTQYEFRLNVENWDPSIEIFVQDDYINTTTPITPNQAYAFSVDANIPASIAEDRFSLVFDNTTLSTTDNAFGYNFSLYPNPAQNGRFYVTTPGLSGSAYITLTNVLGQQVYAQQLDIQNQEVQIHADNLSSGVYMMNLSQSEQSFSTKVIIE